MKIPNSRTNRRALPPIALLLFLIPTIALALQACASSNNSKSNTSQAPQDKTAGHTASYKPTGKIVAGRPYRPERDGFGFENYGNDSNITNLTPIQVQQIFGNKVCASGSGKTCDMTPLAEEWMNEMNQIMDGGHCYGLSVTSLLLYSNRLKPKAFGKKPIYSMRFDGNRPLQATIAKDFSYQVLDSVQSRVVGGSPNKVLDRLIKSLRAKKGELYTLAIFQPNGDGGHAVTPFAVERKNKNRFDILVYDNNFPGRTRSVIVDRKRNTWSYIASTNPNEPQAKYKGNAKTKSMALYPTLPAIKKQPCPFCKGVNKKQGATAGSILKGKDRYLEISLAGDPTDQANMQLTDDQGNRTGLSGGRLINQIPGARVVHNFSNQNWEESESPIYRVPINTDFTVTLDGSGLKKGDTESVDIVGPGTLNTVEKIRIQPGQTHQIAVSDNGTDISYQPDPDQKSSPVLRAAVEDTAAYYSFSARPLDFTPGSTIVMRLNPESKSFIVEDLGTADSPGSSRYALSETQENSTTMTFSNKNVKVQQGDLMRFNFGRLATGAKPPSVVIGSTSGPTTRVTLAAK